VVERVVYYRYIISLLLLIILMQSEDNLSYILPHLRNYLDHVADVHTDIHPFCHTAEVPNFPYVLIAYNLPYLSTFALSTYFASFAWF
jgi:hypothetical protein